MSEWRGIWKKALFANQVFIDDKEKGKEFRDLIQRYKSDGMVYYVRAETYEYVNDYGNALDNYKKAKENFRVDHWKNVAQIGD